MSLGIPSGLIAVLKPVSITTSSLPGGVQNSAYSQSVAATGGTGTYTWSVISGSLPAGLSLNSGTGAITGTPTGYGTSNFTVQATSAGIPGTQALSITVSQRVFTQTISSNTADINMAVLFGNPSGGAGYSYTITIDSGVTVYGTNAPSYAALDIGSMPAGSSIYIVNNGSIFGKGGNGANSPNTPGATGNNGGAGGPAIMTSMPISITNNGVIGGGGGGGGSGGVLGVNGVSGGGGGGGQSFVASSGGTVTYPGTAGAGQNGGSSGGGNGGGGGADGTSGGGSGGTNGATGSAGANYNSVGTSGYTAPGGGGGGWGAAGGNGGSGYDSIFGGAGGAGGKAVESSGQSITWLATGTRYGALT